MTLDTAAALAGGVGLLERAIGYTLGCLRLVSPPALARPTPCQDWDLRSLLAHLDDSFTALREAADIGCVDLDVPGAGPAAGPVADPVADPVAGLRNSAGRLLGSWAGTAGQGPIIIGGCPVTTGIVATAGAMEVAVHGWDIAQACGHRHPIPPALAEEMLELAPLLVTDADRPIRFAPPVRVPPPAGPGDRLVAFLGRRPR